MQAKTLVVLVSACLLLLAACGGGRHGLCTPENTTANCVLHTVPPPPPVVSVTPVAHGIDFAWSCPSSRGYQFGASYLSDSSKDWTRACLAAWPRRVFVWETTGVSPLGGYTAGASDARAARAELDGLGYRHAHVDFAVDFDATPLEQGIINAYFQGADSVLGVQRVGAYGGYWPVTRLCSARLVTLSWQTYAWSGGHWAAASCAPLEQYLNGAFVDYDRAIAANYGQSPWPPLSPSRPAACFGPRARPSAARCVPVLALYHKRQGALAATRRARGSVGRALRADRCRKPYRRGFCIREGRVWRTLDRRAGWFTRAIAAQVKQYS